MQIHAAMLTQFRNFDSIEVKLHPRLTIFIGQNEVGKTNLLAGLAILAGSWLSGFKDVEYPRLQETDLRQTLRYSTVWDGEPLLLAAEGAIEAILPQKDVAWERRFSPGRRDAVSLQDPLRLHAMEADNRVRENEMVTLPLLAFYATRPEPPRLGGMRSKAPLPMGQRELSRLEGYRNCLTGLMDEEMVRRWLEHQDRVAFQQSGDGTLYQTVCTAMSAMMGESYEVGFDPATLEPIVTLLDGTHRPLLRVGTGLRVLALLAGDIAVRAVRLNPHLGTEALKETSGVVLLDEPEMHLHPVAQSQLLQQLCDLFPRMQFVTSTHSTAVLPEGNEHKIIELTREQQQSVARDITHSMSSYSRR